MSTPLRDAVVIPRLPDWCDPLKGDAVPVDLIGATIIRFGAVPQEYQIEGGGLIIDYVPTGKTEPRRLVFGFTEVGMWIEYRE